MRSAPSAFLAVLFAAPPMAASATPTPGPLGPGAMQHGAQPNPGEVRPGSPAGDAPSEPAGALVRQERARRALGLPVTAALLIAAVLLVLLALGGLAIPAARHRARARGGGTCGPR